jgi:hypothetical protein
VVVVVVIVMVVVVVVIVMVVVVVVVVVVVCVCVCSRVWGGDGDNKFGQTGAAHGFILSTAAWNLATASVCLLLMCVRTNSGPRNLFPDSGH